MMQREKKKALFIPVESDGSIFFIFVAPILQRVIQPTTFCTVYRIIKLKSIRMTTIRTKIRISTTNLALWLNFQHHNDNISHIRLAKLLFEVFSVVPSIDEPIKVLLVRTKAGSNAICSNTVMLLSHTSYQVRINLFKGCMFRPTTSMGRYASFTRLLSDLLLLVDGCCAWSGTTFPPYYCTDEMHAIPPWAWCPKKDDIASYVPGVWRQRDTALGDFRVKACRGHSGEGADRRGQSRSDWGEYTKDRFDSQPR